MSPVNGYLLTRSQEVLCDDGIEKYEMGRMDWYGLTSMSSVNANNSHPELDNHYLKYHADKAKRIEQRGEKCYGTAPEAMDGAIELLEEL